MKEKTIEELIKETPCVKNGLDDFFGKQTVLRLLQQVREATIAECVEILTNPNIPKTRMASLKTDRIKLTNENAN